MTWPLIAQNNNRDTIGFGAYFKFTSLGSFPVLWSIQQKCQLYVTAAGAIAAAAFVSGSNGRQGQTTNGVVTTGTVLGIGYEYNSGGATEADKLIITVNGVPRALTFSNLGSGGTLGQLPIIAGNAFLFSQTTSPDNPMSGSVARNAYAFDQAMPGVTSGLLTSDARLALFGPTGYERLT